MKPALVSKLNTEHQTCAPIKPISINTPPYDEEWLQTLVQDNPDLIPAHQIEACFNTLVPVLMEYSLPSGYLDNFLITPDGYPVLVEVKLWKNQESRRKVVAQILEYAKDFSALTYDDLNAEFVKKYPNAKNQDNPLYEAVAGYSPDTLDEISFVDRVSRNLKEGRFLLIILGDGIREELVNLSEYLLQHSLRYAFGLVQIKLFELENNDVIALPSLMGKTQTIERHVTVVNMQGEGVSVSAKRPVINERTEKTSLTTDEFYEQLSTINPDCVVWLKNLIKAMNDIPVELSVGKAFASIVAPLPNGENLILGKVNLRNTIEFWGMPNKKRKNPRWSEISKIYLTAIANASSQSAYVKVFESGHMDVYSEDNDKVLAIDCYLNNANLIEVAMREAIHNAENFFETETN